MNAFESVAVNHPVESCFMHRCVTSYCNVLQYSVIHHCSDGSASRQCMALSAKVVPKAATKPSNTSNSSNSSSVPVVEVVLRATRQSS